MMQGFEDFLLELSAAPEYLSLYIDEQFKRGLKAMSDKEMEDMFDLVLKIFRALSDKDVFERFYKQHFARRLLLNISVSSDAEQMFLQRLQLECGSTYTKKLVAMYHDCFLKDAMMERLRNAVSMTDKKPSFDFSVNVLTLGSWPFAKQPRACTLPPQLSQACRVFEECYYSWHNGRKLTWDFTLGQAEVIGAYAKKKHILQVTTLQMVVLLQFRRGQPLTAKEPLDRTQVASQRLDRILQCLASSKVKLLKKTLTAKAAGGVDTFVVNEGFTSRSVKVRVPQLVSKQAQAAESKETLRKVGEERKHEIEACIVRVLKDRKQMHYNDVVVEVTQQLLRRFEPTPVQIKKCIETLIDREFIERDDKDKCTQQKRGGE